MYRTGTLTAMQKSPHTRTGWPFTPGHEVLGSLHCSYKSQSPVNLIPTFSLMASYSWPPCQLHAFVLLRLTDTQVYLLYQPPILELGAA